MKKCLIILIAIIHANLLISQSNSLKLLQGEWECIEFLEEGKEIPYESIKHVRLTVFESDYMVYMGDFLVAFKIKAEKAASANSIIFTAVTGMNKGTSYYGRFDIQNKDELVVNYSSKAQDKFSLTREAAKIGRYIRWRRITTTHQSMSGRTLTNSLKMKFRLIMPASFVMGASPDEDGRQDELQHRVTISKAFYIGETEVTVRQFRQFIEERSHPGSTTESFGKQARYQTDAEKGILLNFSDAKGGVSTVKNGINSWDSTASWKSPGFSQSEHHPVVFVSWNDANEFCNWLSQKEGKRYRLPTEAEWELAARAGTSSQYWWGNNINSAILRANLADVTYARKFSHRNFGVTSDDKFIYTSPVGSFEPNQNGLYDVIGNVFEWVSDNWAPFTNDPLVNPKGPNTGKYKTAKGGAWASNPNDCRLAFRFRESPDMRFAGIGFRILLEIE